MEPSAVTMILVNLSAMNADLLRVALHGHGQIRVTGSAANAAELAVLLRTKPDIALIASNGSRKEPVVLPYLDQIAEAACGVRPIVLSENMAQEDFVSFLHRGARGLVCKSQTDFPVLVKCILCVHAGQVWANSDQLEQLLCSIAQPAAVRRTTAAAASLLSQREEQVLQLLARGMSNRELAKTLNLSEHTVKNHLFRIFDKLGATNRMEAVLFGLGTTLKQLSDGPETAEPPLETGAA